MTIPLTKVDVLGLGCAAVDDVFYVATAPSRDTKLRVLRRARRFGGLTGTALVAAARLGAHCAYAGQLGTDDFSNSVRENFIREGIDVRHSPCQKDARVVHSTVIVAEDDGSRSIFYESDGEIGPHPELPELGCIRECGVLLVDHYGPVGTLRAATAARSAGIGVVADFEEENVENFKTILELVDHLILSSAFAMRITSRPNARDAARALWHQERAAVIVTCGSDGCWSVDPTSGEPIHRPAFAVKAADTTGCGDVFHGAYAAALARGDSLTARIRFASAAAALRAKLSEIPSRAEVEQWLAASP